ncbi:MAG TPA: hypothetical protein VNZ26_04590 [Vicinamibacterales bacterium]|nr:hypothetical protein [Vicinamibacterales bacterium]
MSQVAADWEKDVMSGSRARRGKKNKIADANLPVLVAGRREYAKLKPAS